MHNLRLGFNDTGPSEENVVDCVRHSFRYPKKSVRRGGQQLEVSHTTTVGRIFRERIASEPLRLQFVLALNLQDNNLWRQFYFDFQGHQGNEGFSVMLVFSNEASLSMYQVKLTVPMCDFGYEKFPCRSRTHPWLSEGQFSLSCVENKRLRNICFHKNFLLLALFFPLI